MFWVNARIDRNFLNRPVKLFLRHFLKFRTRDRLPVDGNPEFSSNNCGGFRMVACNHNRANPRRHSACNCVLCLSARRIDHTDQSQEDEVFLDAFTIKLCLSQSVLWQRAERYRKCSQGFTGKFFIDLQNFCAAFFGERFDLISYKLLRTAGKQYVRCAFGEGKQSFLLLGVTVNRTHQFTLRGERHFSDAFQPCIECLSFQPGFARRYN